MIKIIWQLLTPAMLLFGADAINSAPKPPLEVTYIANCGFLIECAGKKVIVDGLFGGHAKGYFRPSDSVMNLMESASAPFDDVDIILVTHSHVDHFDPDIVAEHLKNNSRGILICPTQAADKVKLEPEEPDIRERVWALGIPADTIVHLERDGVKISAISGRHSSYIEEDSTGVKVDLHRNVQHLEYVIEIEGRTVYHSGDAPMNDRSRYQALGFGAENTDLAFVAWWDEKEQMSFRQKLIKDFIRPDRIILMHLFLTRPPKGNPEKHAEVAGQIILPLNLMEKWVLE